MAEHTDTSSTRSLSEATGSGDIAIVGLSFKLPQDADDDATFWNILENRRNLMTEWPESRVKTGSFLDNPRHKFQGRGAHFLNTDVGVFDAPFFSVTAKEAASMDPMQRWTLEASYRAFENAGIPAEQIRGSRTAVYSASMLEDYTRMVTVDPDNIERTALTGSLVASIIANRVSWYFDLHGPSIHVNTACSSSLAAVDIACKAIQSGDAECALVTSANFLLDPAIVQLLSDQNFLSPDGVCRSFDHRANGYARGEGVIALVLKPVSSAVRDGDMIRAVIRSTGSNQDGYTPILTQPSSQAQEDLIRHVYRQANLPFDQTRYVEAHGTGTPVGDPIEMKALGRVFREYRSAEEPLYVGSVKATVGHLEGASGLAGIVKSILILEKGIIPPNPLFEKMNPAIDADFYHTAVPTQKIVWPGSGLRRISVNSFGFGGANTHVILDDAFHYLQHYNLAGNHHTTSVPGGTLDDLPSPTNWLGNGKVHTNGNGIIYTNEVTDINETVLTKSTNGNGADYTNGTNYFNGTIPINGIDSLLNSPVTPQKLDVSLPKLLVWSAADEKAAKRMMESYQTFYEKNVSRNPTKIDRLAYTLAVRRSQMLWRTFAVDEPEGQAGTKLSFSKPVRSASQAELGFVFTGQGAQYVDMGWDLIQYPVFAETLRQIDGVYESLGCKWSIFDELRSSANINKPEYSQPLSTAVQIALVELLNSFGIRPRAVIGHSSGEIPAAYAIGALSLQSACKVAYYRGQLAGKLKDANADCPGAMMSINLAEDQVPEYTKKIKTADIGNSICVACVNSPFNCTLSGREADIDLIKAQADEDGVFAQKLKTGVAYHSSSMQAIADEYRSLMGSLEGVDRQNLKAPAQILMISSVTGEAIIPAVLATAQYWVDNMVRTVRFADAINVLAQGLPNMKVTDLIEVGPHPALRRPVQDTLGKKGDGAKIRYFSPLHRSQPAIRTMLELVGQLFCFGHDVSITTANQQTAQKKLPFLVDCPEYPFNHSQRYWAESRICRDYRLREPVEGELLGVRVSDWNPLEPRWRNFWSVETSPWIGHHKVGGTVLFPAAGMLVMAIEAVQHMIPSNRVVTGYLFEKAEFISAIIVPEDWEDRTETQFHLRPRKRQASEKDASAWFDTTIYSYTRGQWSESFRASIQVGFRNSSEIDSRERMLADESVRIQYSDAVDDCDRPLDSQVMIREAADLGFQFGEWFQQTQDVRWDGKAKALARVDVSKPKYQTRSLVHPVVLDAGFMALRVSGGQQPTLNVPKRLSNAWFSALGWQHPQTSWVRWMAASTSTLSGWQAVGHGEQGSLAALADDGTVLCTIGEAKTVAMSTDTEGKEKKLLYNVDWKPQMNLLDKEQLALVCGANNFPRDETVLVSSYSKMRSTLDLVVGHALKRLDYTKVPDSLRRHVEWMEYHVKGLPPSQQEEIANIRDAELEDRLCEVETVLPSWKLYTACARKIIDMLEGEIDPLQVVFGSGLADSFYADLFQDLCNDGRFAALLDIASHENPALRIMEVGAGTGGMTGHVLKMLEEREKRLGAPSFAHYTYTDISPAFFERAGRRWPQLQGRMNFKTFDMDYDPTTQGFEPGSYDLIFAASVVHATPDLERAIRHIRKALKPGGRLVLIEVINPAEIIINFMAGLVPGFWVAREDWRPHSPAVPEDIWDKCLRANGFSGNDLIMRDYQSDVCHVMSTIVSTAVEAEDTTQSITKSGRLILVIDKQQPGDGQQRLADAVLSSINPKGDRQATICAFVLEELSNELEGITEDDIVVCLAEVNNRPLLTSLSGEGFMCLKTIIGRAPRLLWATATSTSSAQYPDHSFLQGFVRSIRAEQPDSHIVTIAIENEADATKCSSFIAKAFRASFDSASKELEYIVRDSLLLSGRAVEDVEGNDTMRSLLFPKLQHKSWAEAPAVQLSANGGNSLDSLQFVLDTEYGTDIAPYEVEIEAKVWGLSDQDVQAALGNQEGNQESLGADCAGVVTRVGRACALFRPGDRVCMVKPGCMRKFPRALETSVFKLPDSLSFELVTSILAPGMVAYHALVDIARIQQGDKILIHSAAGSMGQLAIQVAKKQGADIFATASSPEAKQFLVKTYNIPENRIFYGQSALFAKGVMRATRGYGVDIVWNSLTGSDELQASCECVAPNGHFLEIGRGNTTANTTLPMALFAKNITFSVVDITRLKPRTTAKLLESTVQLLGEGNIQYPQPLRVFEVNEIQQAFEQLQDGGEIGRIVIRPTPEKVVPQYIKEQRSWRFDENASYLIAGGSGGVGRAITRWMVDRGAKHLIIPSRSGAKSKAAAETVAELRARGVNVYAPRCDVSSEISLAYVLEECSHTMPPIKGCINATVVLQDAIFQNSMTYEQWKLPIRSKVQTSWNLHRLLPQDMDFFILLSSLAGINGQLASSNYAGGCSFQDTLAAYRRANGQKALSIDLGWMRNVGQISEIGEYQRQRQEADDMQQTDDTELFALLTLGCDPTNPLPISQVLFGLRTPADALAQGRTPAAILDRPLYAAFSYIVGSGSGADNTSTSSNLAPDQQAAALFNQAKDSEERVQVVLKTLASKLARAMSIAPEDVEPSKPLSAYGVDSLMAVQVRNWINREFSAPVGVFEIMGGVSIAGIAETVVAKSTVG
ncbi:uncharacterized protein F4817DRAFT_311507 [Daldinia loculata]|uniref:uncharacterized protein n=1 Tax=Daldinia loculata TaxID=103429 RepID=UPI0020C381EF|nr:uncharacterized protein F4817DRAFT_311507 [Daldinia loculata]KAI1651898.1 hypothetical protein F4817DRAFT_311507 [Daldinia loculata]